MIASSACTYRKFEEIHPTPIKDSIISFAATIAPLTYAKCNSCHVPQGVGNGDFSTYQGIMVKVANGSFYQRVVVNQDMPQSGSGYNLTADERHYFELWLNQGAPNN